MIDNMPKCFVFIFTRNQRTDKLSASLLSTGLKFSKKNIWGNTSIFLKSKISLKYFKNIKNNIYKIDNTSDLMMAVMPEVCLSFGSL